MNQQIQGKVSEIVSKFEIVKNATRQDFITCYIPALIQSHSVQFHRVAQFLNPKVSVESNTARIQGFFREVDVNYQALTIVLYTLLPKNGKLRISIDRTEWDFGTTQVNILMLLIGQGDFQIPFCWTFLDNNSGNSSAQQRIDLMNRCLAVVPVERIGIVLGDREFIGHTWLQFLKSKQLSFCVRVPKSHKIERMDGNCFTVEEILRNHPKGVTWIDCRVDGVWGNVFIRPIEGQENDILFLFGTAKATLLGQLYRKRWCIEACFQQLKTRGFNFEDTHMTHLERLNKLLALITLAYGLCLSIGLYLHHKVKPIVKKNHGYKANSFFRHGKDYLIHLFRKNNTQFCENFKDIIIKAAEFIQNEYNAFFLVV